MCSLSGNQIAEWTGMNWLSGCDRSLQEVMCVSIPST